MDGGGVPAEPVERVVEECAAMLPAVGESEIRRVYRVVRPLWSTNQADADRSISRDFAVLRHGDRDGVPGVTSIVGGKLTTHRTMTERAADAVRETLGVETRCRTAEEPLPGTEDRRPPGAVPPGALRPGTG